MTRAQRFAKRHRDVSAKRPTVSFSGVIASTTEAGDLIVSDMCGNIIIKHDRVPALTRFLRENFVRRDK